MALIQCPECKKEISDKAVACPFCGNPSPIKQPVVIGMPVEVELTNKKWKKRGLWALLIIFVGIIFLGSKDFVGFGILLIFIGIITGISARIGAWWTNG